MEAPKKIYLVNDDLNIKREWYKTKQVGFETTEYTRTDALIEKILDYIENNIYDYYDGDNEYGICSGYVKKEEFIKNFKNYIK